MLRSPAFPLSAGERGERAGPPILGTCCKFCAEADADGDVSAATANARRATKRSVSGHLASVTPRDSQIERLE
jgi:hypothetical protein